MSSAKACYEFIVRVDVHFPAPKFANDKKRSDLWTQSINDVLSPYEDEVVREAADRIIRSRDPDESKGGSMFPKPFEILKVLNEVRDLQAARAAAETMKLESPELYRKRTTPSEELLRSYSDERMEFALVLMRGELGQQAVREGWEFQLFRYACEHNALPKDAHEIAALRKQGRANLDWAERREVKPGQDASILRIFWEGMLNRRAWLREQVSINGDRS